jgi:predicted permease
VERLRLDFRLALRLWARTPGFSLVAIATIALGVGASTALVGQIKAVFWTPLPVQQPEDLRILAWTSPRRPFVLGPNVMAGPQVNGATTFSTVSYAAFLAMRDDPGPLSEVACWADLGEARPVLMGDLGFATVQFVSGNYFRTLGVRAAIGRTIQPDDETRDTWSPVAMVSHGFWQRVFGGASDVTNRTVRLNGRDFTVIGVMPHGFFGIDPSVSPDLIVPNGAVVVAAATQNPLQNRGLWNPCRVLVRVARGRTHDEARMHLERVLAAVIAETPPAEPYDAPRVALVPAAYGLSTLRDGAGPPLFVLLIVVGGLLFAACANIAGLLLVRGSSRSRELATRLALGASRGRLMRQLMTESLVLSLVGGLVGLLLAYWMSASGSALLSQFMPTLFGADRTLNLAGNLDAQLLGFAAALAVLAGVVFGALPALRATRLDLLAVIKENAASGLPRFGLTGGQVMVAAQTAIAILLLAGAGLFLRTLANLRTTDLGFEIDRLLYARVEPRAGGIAQAQRQQFFEDAVARLRTIPGVGGAAAAAVAPLGGDVSVGVGNFTIGICRPSAVREGGTPEMVALNSVTPGYFNALGVPIVAGRDFSLRDRSIAGSSSATGNDLIVNESFARTYFPGVSALGRNVLLAGNNCAKAFGDLTIIGVVADSRVDVRTMPAPTVFIPLGGFQGPVTLVVRAAGDSSALVATVRRAMTELNANVPTFSEAPVAELVERQLRQERLLSSLLSVFAGVTTFICCLGIYGMLAYAVARRRQEISVRMAIGAQASSVVGLMVRESLVPVLAGAGIGVVALVIGNRWLAGLLYGVSSYDPLTLVGACIVFAVVAVLAAALPSRAAVRVNPALALRQ